MRRILFLLLLLVSSALAQIPGVSTPVVFGGSLPTGAAQWTIFVRTDGSGIWECTHAPTCTLDSQWVTGGVAGAFNGPNLSVAFLPAAGTILTGISQFIMNPDLGNSKLTLALGNSLGAPNGATGIFELCGFNIGICSFITINVAGGNPNVPLGNIMVDTPISITGPQVGTVSLGCSGSDPNPGAGIAIVATNPCVGYNFYPPPAAGNGFLVGSNNANKVTFVFQQFIDLSANVGSSVLPIVNGGTGAPSASLALQNLFPSGPNTGASIYWDGAQWNKFNGNTGTPGFHTEDGGGHPNWVAVPIPPIDGGTGLTTLALNTVYKGNTTSGMLPTSIVEAGGVVTIGNPIVAPSCTGCENMLVTNAGTTGTTLNTLTKLTGAPSTAVITATTDTHFSQGICVSNCTTSGTASIQQDGLASCVFDGATTANHYVQISSTVAGNCHDSGAVYPTSGQVIGMVTSTHGSGGTYTLSLYGPEIIPATNFTAGGDLSGSSSTQQVIGLLNHALPGLAKGYLRWDGANWVLGQLVQSIRLTGSSTTWTYPVAYASTPTCTCSGEGGSCNISLVTTTKCDINTSVATNDLIVVGAP